MISPQGWMRGWATRAKRLLPLWCFETLPSSGKRRPPAPLQVEQLETRELLAPVWVSIGPGPQQDTHGLLDPNLAGQIQGRSAPVSGRVTSLAYSPDIGGKVQALFLGSASGGIWRTTDFKGRQQLKDNPKWVQVSDNLFTKPDGKGDRVASGQALGANAIGAITVDPNNPNVIYAGTGEANYAGDNMYGTEILKSTDGGNNWFIAENWPQSDSVAKIVIDPTLDGGKNATYYVAVVPTAKDPPNYVGGVYKVDPKRGNLTPQRLSLFQPGRADPPVFVTDLVGVTVRGNFYLFAAVGRVRTYGDGDSPDDRYSGIWMSNNGGLRWTQLRGNGAPLGAGIGRISLAADNTTPDKPPVIYAAIARSFPNGTKPRGILSVIRSTNLGQTWADITPRARDVESFASDGVFGYNASYHLSLGVVPGKSSTIYLGGMKTFQSTDGGATWSQIDTSEAQGVKPHVDHHAWAFLGQTAIDGNDGGVWEYLNNKWVDLNTTGLSTIQVNSIAVQEVAPDKWVVLEGSQDNGTARAATAGYPGYPGSPLLPWDTVGGGDGGLIRFDTPTSVFRATNGSSPDKQLFNSRVPLNGARVPQDLGIFGSWDNTALTDQQKASGVFAPVFAVSPKFGDHLVMSTGGDIWESERSSNYPRRLLDWTTKGEDKFSAEDPITALTFLDDKTVYAGTSNGELYRTWDITAAKPEWDELSTALGTPVGVPITSLTPLPSGTIGNGLPGVLVTYGNYSDTKKIFRIADSPGDNTGFGKKLYAGDMTGTGLPSGRVFTAVLDTGPAKGIWLGTDDGVYYSEMAKTRKWTRVGEPPSALKEELPNVQVKDLQLYLDGNRIMAGTYGRGVYTTATPGPVQKQTAIETVPLNAVLGTFADSAGFGTYSVSIDWGDGTALDTTSGSVSTSGTTATVSGTHTWADAGVYSFTATVTRGTNSVTLSGRFVVDEATLTATGQNVSGSAGTTLSNVLVSTFTDADTTTLPGDFVAWIDWGDGSRTQGTISGGSGQFSVRGSHNYATAQAFPINVSIVESAESGTGSSSTATITGPVTAQTVPISPVEGISTGTVTVASFTATGSGPFGASIDWGDGHQTTGTVTPNGNGYNVMGSNSYGSAAASLPLTVTITDNPNGGGNTLAVVSSDITVSDAPLTALGSDLHVSQGAPLNNVVVARFTDSNPSDSPAEYSATIDWGDSDPSSSEESSPDTGTIVAEGNGTYAVLGSHVYLNAGNFRPTVAVSDSEGSTATVNPTVTVTAATPVVTSVSPFYGPPAGGTPITIAGTALAGATAVSFGSTPATAFTVNGDGSITAIAPALTAGSTVDVTVTTPQGTSATSAADQYTAVAAAPTVTALSSSSGPTGGGSSLTLTGTGFGGTTAISFGGIPAPTFNVTSNTSLSVTVPAQLAGTVDVTVTTPYGTSATSSADRYTYNATAPSVTGLDSSSGPAAGGSLLQLTGVNFNAASQVLFGTTAVTNFTLLDATSILVTTPAMAAGTVDVKVTTPYGTSAATSADQYTAVTAPAVTSLSSSSGPTGGGGSLTLTGTGFSNAQQVLFGTTPANSFTVISDTSVSATVPAGTSGGVTVSVTTAGGTSASGSGSTYTYNATAPAISAVGPNAGPTAGGTTVNITGTNLNGVSAVNFGSTPAADFTVVSATQVTATAPAGTAGASDITVTTPSGTSATSSADQFTFADAAAPVVSRVSVSGQSVASGPMAGGTSVTVTGTGFSHAIGLNFGSVAATSFTVNSDTQITVTAPSQAAGTVAVSVTTPYGASGASPFDQFSYLAAVPSVSSLSVSSGSTAGGDSVTISGVNFSGVMDVRFGGVSAAFTSNGDNSISATTPAHVSGLVDVTVVGPAGTSTSGSADQFTFNAASGLPTVSSLGTTSGPTGGGTAVTLTGTGFLTTTGVSFGSANATSFSITSDTSLTALTPPGTGSVTVSVTNASGVSAATGAFSYQATAPTVSGLSLGTGPATGGSSITILGANLNGASAVKFGSVAATSFTINSPTSITAVAPTQAAGTVQVTVTTPNGTSATSGASQFQYVSASAPTVTAVTPAFGPMAGGTSVSLLGSGFTGASQVLFGSIAATGVSVLDDAHLTATAPAQVSGSVDVTVTTPAGTSAVSSGDSFQYVAVGPAVTSLGTTSGPTVGGTAVTINGSNLLGTTGVSFGSTPAVFFQVLSDSQIKAISPLAAAGAVQVTVTTPDGTSPTGSGTTFTYNVDPSATPTVTGLSQSSGPSSGGTTLTLTGSNLAGTLQVLFGQTAATFTQVSSTSLNVTVPAGVVGTVDVTVQTPLGLSATGTADQFTYQTAVPTITGLSPNTDTSAGGTVITITGANFNTVSGVTFGGVPASQFTITSNTSLTVVDPVGAVGTVNVQVTNADGTSAAAPFSYTATANTPTLTSLSATSGASGGGNQIMLTGTNFSNVLGVFFGSTPADAYTVTSPTSITATVPAATAGAVTVTVSTDAGVSAAGSGTTYTYNATAPSVTAISPASGPTAGGTSVVITGLNLNGATAVAFAGTAATGFSINSATQITATAPAGTSGTAQVTVTTLYGTSSTSGASQFTYVAAPTVASLGTTSGSTNGGTSVTITGTNFSGLVSVSFGGVSATAVTVNSSTSLTATAPAEGPGAVDVQVTTPQGTSAVVSTDQFTFNAPVPSVTGVSPASSALAGGGTVTISGSGFTNASGVSFGGVAATGYTVTNDTSITATVPAATGPGAVDVQVSGPYGDLSPTGTADQFTYYDMPAITALSTSSDTASGGASVTITGVNLGGATGVSFGGTAATSFVVNSDASITAVAPAHAVGAANVTVTTPGGTSAAAGFSYSAASAVSWVGPTTGDWATLANWSTGVLPGLNDDVSIPSGVTVFHSTGTDSVHSLNVQGSLMLSGGSLSLAATSYANSLTQTGGMLSGAGNLTVGSFFWSGGIQAGTGTTSVSFGSLDSSVSALVVQGRTINSSGNVTWSGSNALQLNGGAIWNNQSSGNFTAQGNATVTAASGTGTFQNAGTFTESSGTGTTTFTSLVAFNNTGRVNVQSGTLSLAAGTNSATISVSSGATLNFAGSYTLTSASIISGSGAVAFSAGTTIVAGRIAASTITVQSGAAITGAATLNGAVTNSGTIHVGGGPGVAGTLTINGSFTQTSTGVLNVEVGGTTAGSQFDQLIINGSANLGGTLNVSLLNGFVPAPGNSFPVLLFNASSGAFATITGLTQSGVQFGTQSNATNFTLVVMSSRPSQEDEEASPEEGVPDRPGLQPGEAVVSTESADDAAAAWAWWPQERLTEPLALLPEDAFFIALAGMATPCDEDVLMALAGQPAPAADTWQELMNLLAGLLNVLFGLV